MKRSCYPVLTYDYVTKAQPAGFVVERVDFYTRDGDTTVQERLRSAFLLLCSEALDTNYTVKSFQVELSKNDRPGIIEGELLRDGGGNDTGATGINKLGKAIVKFPMTVMLLIKQTHFLLNEIRYAEKKDSIEEMLIVNSAMTQLTLQVGVMFYELGG